MEVDKLGMIKGRRLSDAESRLMMFDDTPDIPDGLIPMPHIREGSQLDADRIMMIVKSGIEKIEESEKRRTGYTYFCHRLHKENDS